MAALNHTIAGARDPEATARFYAEVFGFDEPVELGPFWAIRVSDDTSIDFAQTDDPIQPTHYAFLVTEQEFDEIFDRVKARGMAYWADPFHLQPDAINRWDDGRGVYFDDPNGHRLEILTRPYGSAGLEAEHPNPLLTPRG